MKSIEQYKLVNFKPKWDRMKYHLDDTHLDLFYDVVDIDGNPGRRIYPGCGREDNPRFYTHWFAAGRCHWNVVLPCFMFNEDNFIGDFKIITNDRHSIIFDSKNEIIMCPTLNDKKSVYNFFKDGFEIQELLDFLPSITSLKAFEDFTNIYYEEQERAG